MKELTASKGYIVDVTAHNVTVEPEKTAAVTETEVPQSNPMDLLLQKLDKERKKAEPQGNASLAEAQFTVKFYTEQSDTDPAASGAKPARTWIFKTDAEGKAHFSKSYLVSGAAFYTQTDGKTPCLPLGTVTVQETKAPAGYFVNDTVFVQKITAGAQRRRSPVTMCLPWKSRFTGVESGYRNVIWKRRRQKQREAWNYPLPLMPAH